MKNKILFYCCCVFAAILALLFTLLPTGQNSFKALFRRCGNDEEKSDFFSISDNMPRRPVLKTAKGLRGQSANPEPIKFHQHVPLPMECWLQGLRQQLGNKVELQTRRITQPGLVHANGNTRRKHPFGRGGKLAKEKGDEPDLADAPFLLWRELQLREDNSLLINMMLVNNRRQEQSHGVIVSQILPAGWNLCAAWPDVQVANQEKRELKWLFAEASSRRNWPLQVVLTPEEGAEMPLLPEKSTTLRCCLPGGKLMQYACLSLP